MKPTDQTHPEELLPAYAMGSLDPEELAMVKTHLEDCPACRKQVHEFEEISAALASMAPRKTPPAALRDELLRTCATRHARTGWHFKNWLSPIPLAISLATLILIGLAGLFLLNTSPPPTLVQLAGTGPSPKASGTMEITPGETRAQLHISGLQVLPPDAQYQLWLIRDGVRSNGGVFSVAADGTATLVVTAETPLDTFDAFGVTIEPHGGSPGPTGPKVLGGKYAG